MASTPNADAVLLLRWDAVFFTQFSMGDLNWSLFYRANWCVVAANAEADGNGCLPLRSYHDSRCPKGDVPDYWFASNPSTLRSVFDSALEDLGKGEYKWAGCGVLHGICLLYTSPSPRDATLSRMPSSA